jgi:nucleotide-binding universal stress UspA family protein
MVPIFKKILFTTDLSENSRHAFVFAASMATRYDGEITILHVMENALPSIETILAATIGEEKWQELKKSHESAAKEILIGKKKDHEMIQKAMQAIFVSEGMDVEHNSIQTHDVIIKSGRVIEEILKTAEDIGSDLIVMGSHKGFISANVVGSVAKGVLQKTRIPVLIVPPLQAKEKDGLK